MLLQDCPQEEGPCRDQQWGCSRDHECVPSAWRCDGEADCRDGSDEASCEQRAACPLRVPPRAAGSSAARRGPCSALRGRVLCAEPPPGTAGGSRPSLGVVPMGLVASVLGYPVGRLLAQLWALLPRVLGTLWAHLSLPWACGSSGRGSGQLPPVCPCRPARSVSEPRVPLRAGGLPQRLPGVQRAAGLRERLRRGGELLPALPATLLTTLPPFTPGPRECQQPSPGGFALLCCPVPAAGGAPRSPLSPQRCYCAPGYRLAEDGLTCVDIDECTEWGERACSQTCLNAPGSYSCSCLPGYLLEPDGHVCKLSGKPRGLQASGGACCALEGSVTWDGRVSWGCGATRC